MESFDKLSDTSDSPELTQNKGETNPVVIPLITSNEQSNNLYNNTEAPAKLGDNSNSDLLVYMPISSMNNKNAFNFSKTNIMFVIIKKGIEISFKKDVTK